MVLKPFAWMWGRDTDAAGIRASSQHWTSPPVLSCLQLAVELHPGKSCHSPGTSTTVQQQPGHSRVSGDKGGQVLGSVFLLGCVPGLCPHNASGEAALPAASSMRSCPSCVPITCPWLGMLEAHGALGTPKPFGEAQHTVLCARCLSPCPGCPDRRHTQHLHVSACRRTPSVTRGWLPSPPR